MRGVRRRGWRRAGRGSAALAIALVVAVTSLLVTGAAAGARQRSRRDLATPPAEVEQAGATATPSSSSPLPPAPAPVPAAPATSVVASPDPLGQALTAQATGDLAPAAPVPAPDVATTTTAAARVPLRTVSGVGDSIMVGATDALSATLYDTTGATLDVNARIGRRWVEGVRVVSDLVARGALGDAVVVHLGTNGPIDEPLVRSLLDQLTGVRLVLLVNVRAPVRWESSVNEVLAAVGPTYPNVRLVDWHAAGIDHDELFWEDGIHLRPAGNEAYAALLASALSS